MSMGAFDITARTWGLAGLGAVAGLVLLVLRRRAVTRRAVVTHLYVYPIKSCRGVGLREARVDAGGIQHDREWMVVRRLPEDESQGLHAASTKMVTIRDEHRIATIQPSFTATGALRMSAPDMGSIEVDDRPDGESADSVVVWRSRMMGTDQGDAAAAWITTVLGCADRPVRLIRMRTRSDPDGEGDGWRRLDECDKYAPVVAAAEDKGGVSGFSDWSQFSVVSTQSLSWLERILPSLAAPDKGVSGGCIDRMRTNIVVRVEASQPWWLGGTGGTFDEDTWLRFRIGEVSFRFLKHCGRCLVPCIDPTNGVRDKNTEPMVTLKRLRGGLYPFLASDSPFIGREAFFSINCRHYYQPGQVLRVGDAVHVDAFQEMPKLID